MLLSQQTHPNARQRVAQAPKAQVIKNAPDLTGWTRLFDVLLVTAVFSLFG